ncbi:MAG: hypothetical protein DCE90_11125 [Pseudanabaena sp.]|nr:MAG: hypothetical protein DCE90_11125 [Pseudanabaena sp.]
MSKKVGRSFWVLWLVANVIGGMLLPLIVWQEPYNVQSRIFLNEILQSIGISIAQSLVLRDRFVKENWWFPLTIIGWGVGLTIVYFVPALSLRFQKQDLPPLTILLADFAIIGLMAGICQWQLLRRFRAGGLWLFASAIALSVSTLGLYLGYKLNSLALASCLQGAIYGAITGLAMVRILRSPKLLPKPKLR